MTEPILSKHKISKVTKISYKDMKDKGLSIWIWVQVGHVPERSILDDFEALLKEELKRNVTVSIWPEFVMTKQLSLLSSYHQLWVNYFSSMSSVTAKSISALS